METYIALLRGINVSGQKKIKMADLKVMFEDLGCISVTTYIQSGNVVFQYKSIDTKKISVLITKGILTHFGFDVPVLVLTHRALVSIYENNPFLEQLKTKMIEDKKMYFTLLFNEPDSTTVAEFANISYDNETIISTSEVVYLYAGNGYGKTKLTTVFFEKKLNVMATTRNLKTMHKLIELSKL
ncbi:DUF1697 domain-containing protein [Aquimarina longa]|uniref:DUF1697 domain-containing protein n=1 Tax=Aquimarina longa TaxID=1080221 RepID=UPI000780B04E|nr:DUF1697 domain-containing protein [Aquimarina longa]